jgi:hypothetical protein
VCIERHEQCVVVRLKWERLRVTSQPSLADGHGLLEAGNHSIGGSFPALAQLPGCKGTVLIDQAYTQPDHRRRRYEQHEDEGEDQATGTVPPTS